MKHLKMKYTAFLLFIMFIALFSSSCSHSHYLAKPLLSPSQIVTTNNHSSVAQTPAIATQTPAIKEQPKPFNYRNAMRQWVIKISYIAKNKNPNFLIIPQNCSELLTQNGDPNDPIEYEFIQAIDGAGQESMSFGYDRYNQKTADEIKKALTDQLNIGKQNGCTILTLDYCKTKANIQIAIEHNKINGYVGFQAKSFALTDIPDADPYLVNAFDILSLNEAKNCLFILNPEKYDTSEDYIQALCNTNYDILVIDAYFEDDQMLSLQQLSQLKYKANGAKRLVISYLSIGEAEDYRYYFNDDYHMSPPDWLLYENPNWKGNYIVKYWNQDWQSIIAANEDSYLKRIIDTGFDGVYLDIIDGYQNFE